MLGRFKPWLLNHTHPGSLLNHRWCLLDPKTGLCFAVSFWCKGSEILWGLSAAPSSCFTAKHKGGRVSPQWVLLWANSSSCKKIQGLHQMESRGCRAELGVVLHWLRPGPQLLWDWLHLSVIKWAPGPKELLCEAQLLHQNNSCPVCAPEISSVC